MKSHCKPPEVLNRGSLLTYLELGQERCFGYLFEFPGHGVFEPTFGKLEVTSEEAKTHNRLLSQGEIDGLDSNCALGMGGSFYTRHQEGRTIVVTWMGEEVSQEVQIKGQVLTFHRRGMAFRGRLRQDEDAFSFRRVAVPARPRGKQP
jgi:hypothetical protein